MSCCHKCVVQLTEGNLFCISCGARQPEQVKIDPKSGAPAVTSAGYLLVQPIGLYNAPLDETRLLFRLEVKLLKLSGVLALAALGVIGGLVLMFLYLLTASLLHIYG